ncbi:MAG: hypothetical protein ACYDCI_10795 [Candidatus Limnocylindrales bacterium]
MAIDIAPFELPVVPGTATGLYELPDEQAERILGYVKSLFEAKNAGVLGAEIRHLQGYVDKVVAQRVGDARTGGKTWADRCAEMDRDEAAWRVRTADHGARAIERAVTSAGLTRDEAALALARRAMELDPATLLRLRERDLEAWREDVTRTETLTLGRIDPLKACLTGRTATRLRSDSTTFKRAQMLFGGLPGGAREAAVALAAWDELSLPEQAILYGPWAEIVDGDPSILAGAWTEAADRIRSQWHDLPENAFDWSPDKVEDDF